MTKSEQGTHAELFRQRGHYYRLYTEQFRHELEAQYGTAGDLGGTRSESNSMV